jgi:hypothetical protein
VLLLSVLAVPVMAQEAAPPESVVPLSVMPPSVMLPAGTLVALRVETEMSSKTAKRGDRFPLSLAADILLDGRVVVPAGARGEGEVVHSAGTGFGGRAGELLLAARYLEIGAARLKLQSFKIAKTGANNTAEAVVLSNVVLPVGLLITGSSAVVPAGQVATAKTAEAFALPPAGQVAVQPEETPE